MTDIATDIINTASNATDVIYDYPSYEPDHLIDYVKEEIVFYNYTNPVPEWLNQTMDFF